MGQMNWEKETETWLGTLGWLLEKGLELSRTEYVEFE